MKKIAVPAEKDTLSPHFGHCEYFAVYEIENNQITGEVKLQPPAHQPGLYPKWLSENLVTDVIAGGMGQRAIELFNQNGINVYVGANIKSPKELVQDFLNGTLTTNANMCDH